MYREFVAYTIDEPQPCLVDARIADEERRVGQIVVMRQMEDLVALASKYLIASLFLFLIL